MVKLLPSGVESDCYKWPASSSSIVLRNNSWTCDSVLVDGDLQEVARWRLHDHTLRATGGDRVVYLTTDHKVSVYSLPRHEHKHDLTHPGGRWSYISCCILQNGDCLVADEDNKQLCLYSSMGELSNMLYLYITSCVCSAVQESWSNCICLYTRSCVCTAVRVSNMLYVFVHKFDYQHVKISIISCCILQAVSVQLL